MKFASKHLLVVFFACLTLGLAPFFPEPHIWGKLKWVAGGAVGMKPQDWFDLMLHGTPWVLLLLGVFYRISGLANKPTTSKHSDR